MEHELRKMESKYSISIQVIQTQGQLRQFKLPLYTLLPVTSIITFLIILLCSSFLHEFFHQP